MGGVLGGLYGEGDEEPGRGSVYRFSSDRRALRRMSSSDVTISNGLGWSPDRSTLYYVDSGPGTIRAFDVDAHGDISNPRLFAAV